MSTQLLLKNTRLGFPKLWEPAAVTQNGRPLDGSRPRFSCNLHISDQDAVKVQLAIREAIEAKWPDPKKRPHVSVTKDPMTWFNKNHKTGAKSAGMRLPLVWGPAEWPDDSNATGWVLITSSPENSPPAVVEKIRGMNVSVEERAKVYPGAEAHAYVGIYGYSMGQEGVACGLNGILLTGNEMGRFDSRPTVDQMFGGITDDDVASPDDPFGDSTPGTSDPGAEGAADWADDDDFPW